MCGHVFVSFHTGCDFCTLFSSSLQLTCARYNTHVHFVGLHYPCTISLEKLKNGDMEVAMNNRRIRYTPDPARMHGDLAAAAIYLRANNHYSFDSAVANTYTVLSAWHVFSDPIMHTILKVMT